MTGMHWFIESNVVLFYKLDMNLHTFMNFLTFLFVFLSKRLAGMCKFTIEIVRVRVYDVH